MADEVQNGTVSFAFGKVSGERLERSDVDNGRFRIALMGDFSGRAARGEVEIGDDLASRRPIKLDVDTLDNVIRGFATTLVLPIGKDGAGIEVKLAEIDDLHPDELFDHVEMFEELVALKRRLASGSTAKGTAAELVEWGKAYGKKVSPPMRKSVGNAVPTGGKLSDFSRLVGGTLRTKAAASSADELLQRVVGPFVEKLPDPNAAAMQEAVEESLAAAMRLVLHHPEFQSVEAQWRMLDLLTRSIETDQKLDIILYDISAAEFAADLAAQEDLTDSGVCRLLVESTPDGRGPFSAVCTFFTFEETVAHAELLGRAAKVAAHVCAPFFAAITPAFLDVKLDDREPAVARAWDALREMPEAGYLGLVSPRFLLRRLYGAKTDPVYEFDFEEFTEHAGLSGMLWANPVVLVAILLAKSYRKNGPSLKLGSIMTLGEMPYHVVKDRYGDQVALPCTERNMTQVQTQAAIGRGYMPIISVKGRDEVRLGSFNALNGGTVLGFWAEVPPPAPKAEPAPPADTEEDVSDDTSSDDTDLDALLAEDSNSSDLEDLPIEDSDSSDLDELLSGLDGSGDDDDSSGEENDEDMDAELAALLDSL